MQLIQLHFDMQRQCLQLDTLNPECNYRSQVTGVIPRALSNVAFRKQTETVSFAGESASQEN